MIHITRIATWQTADKRKAEISRLRSFAEQAKTIIRATIRSGLFGENTL